MARTSASVGIILAILALPLSARATLGEDAASVRADGAQINATPQMNAVASYTQFEMQTPSGTIVREYVSPAGRVFAIAWNGPLLPDLRQLLGSYFARYLSASDSDVVGTGPRAITQPGFVIQAGGHMRAFFGMAFVPELVPAGVDLADIR